MPLNDTVYKLKGNKNITLWILTIFLTLTFLSSIARYSDHALYEVSELNPHITSSEFNTVRLGFQHTSAGIAGNLHCSQPSEQLLLAPPHRSSAPRLSQVKSALGAAVPPPKKGEAGLAAQQGTVPASC